MKTTVSLLIILLISSNFPSNSIANIPVLSTDENEKKPAKSLNGRSVLTRDYVSVVDFDYDQIENQFKKIRTVSFEEIMDINTRISNIINYAPNGSVESRSRIIIRGDSLNRDVEIEKQNYQETNDSYFTTERTTFSYYLDTDKLTSKETFVIAGSHLELGYSERWYYDHKDNLTLHINQQFDPYSGLEVFAKGDSVKNEYDESDNIVKRMNSNYDYYSQTWNHTESQTYEWNSNNFLNSVTISSLNADGTFNAYTGRISEIKYNDSGYESYQWEDASSYVTYIWNTQGTSWLPNERIENYVDNKYSSKTTSKYQGSEYVPWKKEVYENFHVDLYDIRKYNIFRADPRSFFEDRTESTYFEEDGWTVSFATRNKMELGIIVPIGEKNGNIVNETDSTLTLIKQTFIPGTGEWLNNFKQEFVFRNTATGIEDVNFDERITLYPNPTNGLLNVQINDIHKLKRIAIVNSVGQTLSTNVFNNFSGNYLFNKDLKQLNKGIYIIQIISENNVVNRKFILQ